MNTDAGVQITLSLPLCVYCCLAVCEQTVVVATDGDWTGTAAGPVVSASIYDGETYDARLEQPGWSTPQFVPTTPWTAVAVASCGFDPVLSPHSFPGIGVDGSAAVAQSVTRVGSGQVVDFGNNLSGWVSIRVKGEAGSNITLLHAEVLQHPPYGPADGSICT